MTFIGHMMNSKEFCNLLEISNSTYSQIESNKQQGNIETILKITNKLKLKVEDIWYIDD